MFDFVLVDVESINSVVPRSNFAEADLENLADLIIETGGLINPLVVKMTGLESYTVVDGDLAYYAAVRAREKNPRKCEMVNAFLISPTAEDLVRQQIDIIKVPDPDRVINGGGIAELLEQNLKPIYTRINELSVQLNKNVVTNEIDEKLALFDNKIEHLISLVNPPKPEKITLTTAIDSQIDEKLRLLDSKIEHLISLVNPPKPEKINLLKASESEIVSILKKNKFPPKSIQPTIEAINYWKKSDSDLTWINLEESTKAGKHKIKGFGIETYKKLKQLTDIQ